MCHVSEYDTRHRQPFAQDKAGDREFDAVSGRGQVGDLQKHVAPDGTLRKDGVKVVEAGKNRKP